MKKIIIVLLFSVVSVICAQKAQACFSWEYGHSYSYEEIVKGKFKVTEEGKEFFFHFPFQTGHIKIAGATLRFSIMEWRGRPVETSVLADGTEIFEKLTSRRQQNFEIIVPTKDLEDSKLLVEFLAPYGSYVVSNISLDIQEMPTPISSIPIPGGIFLLGSGLCGLLAVKNKTNEK